MFQDVDLNISSTGRYTNSGLQDESDDLGGESNEEVVWQRDPKIVNYNWTKEATRLLIGLRTSLDSEFDDPNQRKMDLWERIAGVLSDHGFEFPPSICDKKWRNLLVSFRRTISRGTQGKINRFPYTWEFYNDLYEYWKKKDPAGFGSFDMAANGGCYGPETSDDVEDTEENDQQDLEEQEQEDGGEESDMHKFLTVTLSDSEGEEGDPFVEDDYVYDEEEKNEEEPEPPNMTLKGHTYNHKEYSTTLPLPPSLTVEPATFAQYRARETGSSRETPSPQQSQRFMPQLHMAQLNSTSHHGNTYHRERPRRAIPTITIEEVTPSNMNKRSHPDLDEEEVPFQMSSIPSGVNISMRERERPELKNEVYLNGGADFNGKRLRRDRGERDHWDNDQSERVHGGRDRGERYRWDRDRGEPDRIERVGERDDLTPPAWFQTHLKESEERDRARWEEEKAIRTRECEIRTREFEATRDLYLQKIQAMNRLSSALLSFVDGRPGIYRPSST